MTSNKVQEGTQHPGTSPPKKTGKKNGKRSLMWFLVAVVAALLTLLIAPATGLEPTGQKSLATFVFILIIWITEAVPYPVSTFFLLGLMTWAGLSPDVNLKSSLKSALSGFSGTVPITCITGTALAVVVKRTGLSERMVYFLMRILGGARASAKRVLGALFMVDVPMAFLVPSATGRCALYLSIVEGLDTPFKFKPLDSGEEPNPFQKAAYMAAAIVPVIMGAAFLTAAEATLLSGRLIEEATGITQTWAGTFVILFIPAIIMMAITWFILVRMFPSSVETVSISFIQDRLQAMGPMSRDEKFVLTVLLAAILLWVTDGIHGIPAEIVLIMAAAVLFIPGFGPGNWKQDYKSIAWGSFMVIAVATSFSTQLTNHGVLQMFADWLGTLGAKGFLAIMLVMVITTVVLRLGMASITAAATLFIPLALTLGASSGLVPAELVGLGWIVYVFCRAGYLLPQQTAQVMMVYDFNMFGRRDLLKAGGLITLATLVVQGLWFWLVVPKILM